MAYLTEKYTTDDLLDCPFCGGRPKWHDGSSTKPYIRCEKCGMRTWGSFDTDKLRRAWNRRVTNDA